jgi:VWFA-related protein
VNHPSFALVLLSLALGPGDIPNEPALHIHKRVSEVQLTLVAEDSRGRPRQGLSPAEIAVREDGRAIDGFMLRPAEDLPLRIGIVLDLSGSTAITWDQVRRSLVGSVQELLRPEDQVLLVTFGRQIELEQTIRHAGELQALLPVKDGGGLTALYDSVYRTCDDREFFDDAGPRRSALILFSDGEDNLSLKGLGEVIAQAQRAGIAIYTVTMHN